MAAMIVQEGV